MIIIIMMMMMMIIIIIITIIMIIMLMIKAVVVYTNQQAVTFSSVEPDELHALTRAHLPRGTQINDTDTHAHRQPTGYYPPAQMQRSVDTCSHSKCTRTPALGRDWQRTWSTELPG